MDPGRSPPPAGTARGRGGVASRRLPRSPHRRAVGRTFGAPRLRWRPFVLRRAHRSRAARRRSPRRPAPSMWSGPPATLRGLRRRTWPREAREGARCVSAPGHAGDVAGDNGGTVLGVDRGPVVRRRGCRGPPRPPVRRRLMPLPRTAWMSAAPVIRSTGSAGPPRHNARRSALAGTTPIHRGPLTSRTRAFPAWARGSFARYRAALRWEPASAASETRRAIGTTFRSTAFRRLPGAPIDRPNLQLCLTVRATSSYKNVDPVVTTREGDQEHVDAYRPVP